MDKSWFDLLTAALSGGLAVKLLDYVYQEHIRKTKEVKDAKKIIDTHLDPILKAADELVGKLRYSAQSDFRGFVKAVKPENNDFEKWFPFLELVYLFAQFWARIQILRQEGLYENLGADKRGNNLLNFFRALESSKIQIIGRAWQRGIGETLIKQIGDDYYCLTSVEFSTKFLSDSDFRRWYQPLVDVIFKLEHQPERQKLLVYGTIIHAMIDTLDQKHYITSKKPAWPNKLSTKNRRDLRYRVFNIYLPFVKDHERYIHVE